MMGGFDPGAAVQNLAWLKPELLLLVVGFVLLGLSVVLPADRCRAIAAVALVGVVAVAFLVAAYGPAVPGSGPKVAPGPGIGTFSDADGHPAYVTDGFSVVLKFIFLIGAALAILLAVRFLDYEGAQSGEFYAMVVFAVLGMMMLASGNDFAVLLIGLETMALSVYVLVGFAKGNRKSNEAALKYFLLGVFASAILLYGVSLVYGTTGSYNLDGLAAAIARGETGPRSLLGIGAILVLVGIAFKIAAVPFHMWTPDAYEGAPTPVTAFISTAAKAAAFAMLLRVFLRGFYGLAADWTPLLVVLAIASMTLGNVVAILQDNVKRMLAYSSIAHAGYMLLGLIAVGASGSDAMTQRYGMTAVVLYLLVYTFTNMGAFGLVVMLRRHDVVGDRVEDFRGLARSNPLAAATMLVFLLSLAGIPCTSGFIGKWWLFGSAVKADYAWLAVIAVVNSAISLYYYARVVVAMYMSPAKTAERVAVPVPLAAALAVSLVFTLVIGVYPQPFIRFAQYALLPLAAR
jgi:NADH-quinone oxidoreductase subunit N